MSAPAVNTWRTAFRDALTSGSVASVLSAVVLADCGRREPGTAAGPLNGPSQWLFGSWAAHRRDASLRHTVLGYAIHHGVSIGWAAVHEKHITRLFPAHSVAGQLAASAVTASLAYLVDYEVAPRRLQPGFDKQLSGTSLVLVYASFAVGLVLGGRVKHLRNGGLAEWPAERVRARSARGGLSPHPSARRYSGRAREAAHSGGAGP
jgi:hypothetical protein